MSTKQQNGWRSRTSYASLLLKSNTMQEKIKWSYLLWSPVGYKEAAEKASFSSVFIMKETE